MRLEKKITIFVAIGLVVVGSFMASFAVVKKTCLHLTSLKKKYLI